MKKILIAVIAQCALSTAVSAKVALPKLFQSGMVVQRSQTIPIWGTADAGENVSVTFRGKAYTTTAAADGKWRVDLPKQKAGGPYEMTVNDITLTDILVGDVWIVSGQSNVDTHLERVYPQYTTDIDNYTNDKIRLFHVPVRTANTPQDDVAQETWHYTNKENAWHFSALGYFLGQKMWDDTKVPQGIIQTSQGGTPIQAWMAIDSIKGVADYYEKFLLFSDPEYNQLMGKANSRGGDVWTNTMNAMDPGFGKFEKKECDDSQWQKVDQYDTQKWAKGLGSVWLRQHVYVDAAHAGKECVLNMGTLHDMDMTYVNGQHVGTTYYQYPPRRYKIPAGLLKEGDNVISVRIICKSGKPYFYKDKPHEFTFGEQRLQSPERDRIEISTQWLTHPGGEMTMAPLGGRTDALNQASVLYNAMVYPLAPYAVSGVVWYQGESNTGKGWEYEMLLRKMTGNWRTLWNREDLPFNIVQLANHMEPSERPQDTGWSQVREAQRKIADEQANTTLTVAIDLGEASDIHPLKKREVAERCALALSNQVYGKKNVLFAEPIEATLENASNIVVTMNQPMKPQENVCEMEVKGADGKFHTVNAKAEGNRVIIPIPSSLNLNPTSTIVRYAWKNNPDKANLIGRNELPASPFQISLK